MQGGTTQAAVYGLDLDEVGGVSAHGLINVPPATGVQAHIEMRVNSILLDAPIVENSWRVYRQVPPAVFAAGEQQAEQIGKLELHVRYRAG